MKIISFHKWNDCGYRGFWVRVFCYGIKINNGPMLFSERYGYNYVIKLPRNYKLRFLSKDKP